MLGALIAVGIAAALAQIAFGETRDRAIRNVADATKHALYDRVKADLQEDYVANGGTFAGAALDRNYRNGIGKYFTIVSGSATAAGITVETDLDSSEIATAAAVAIGDGATVHGTSVRFTVGEPPPLYPVTLNVAPPSNGQPPNNGQPEDLGSSCWENGGVCRCGPNAVGSWPNCSCPRCYFGNGSYMCFRSIHPSCCSNVVVDRYGVGHCRD